MSDFIGTFEESLQKKKEAKKITQKKKKVEVAANNLLQYATNVEPEEI